MLVDKLCISENLEEQLQICYGFSNVKKVMDVPEENRNILQSPGDHNLRYGSIGSLHRDNFKVYKRRWYILLVFFICSTLNGLKWNTWSPIQGTSQVVFGWSDTTITLLVTWGPIVFVVVFLPMSWLMDVKGKKGILKHRNEFYTVQYQKDYLRISANK